MTEIHEGPKPIQQTDKCPPVEWKIVNIKNAEQTVTVLYPAQSDEHQIIEENGSPVES